MPAARTITGRTGLVRMECLNAIVDLARRGADAIRESICERTIEIVQKGAGRAFGAGYDITPTAGRTAARASRDMIGLRKAKQTVLTGDTTNGARAEGGGT